MIASVRLSISSLLLSFCCSAIVFFFKQKTAYELRISDWSSDVCSSDLQTFIGELYAMAGLENIADAADVDGQSGGYPQLSAEYVIDADPDIIFLADAECCGQTEETVAARPGFATLSAVEAGNIVLLDEDIASRWGPRVEIGRAHV